MFCWPITTEGKRHLGTAIGTRPFIEEYVAYKVRKWVEEFKQLATIAQTQPHAAYTAYIHCLSKTFLSKTIPNIATLLQPLEDAIQQHLIPTLTGHPPCSHEVRDLLTLPVRLGGMGITNPVSSSARAYKASSDLISPLVVDITNQNQAKLLEIFKVMETKSFIRQLTIE